MQEMWLPNASQNEVREGNLSDWEVVENFLDIYTHDGKESVFDIQPAHVIRQWMNDTGNWAYNCLPLKIANQYGWVAHSPCSFTATWDGGPGKENLTITNHEFCTTDCHYATSHFAHGILTVNTDILVKTTPGTSLYIRGLTNTQKDIIYPMDAIVETDWLPFHFPFSLKFLKPGTITYTKGEPLFMFFPIQRQFIETFDVSFKHIDSNPDLKEQQEKFNKSRAEHMAGNNYGAQKFYIKGSVVDERADIEEHKVKLRLKEPKVVE